jgi:hypothetical protein
MTVRMTNEASNEPQGAEPAKPYEPTEQERAAMTDYLRRCKAWMKLWLVKIETVRGGVSNLPDHCDRRLWTVAVEQAFGTVNHPFAAMMMGLVSGVADRCRHRRPTGA